MKKVLIVNDSRFERQIMKDQLWKKGVDVEATDEYCCMAQIEQLLPDVVIVNLTMQSITGDKLIETIKKNWPEITCYLCSCNELDINDYRDKRVDGVFQTPLSAEALQRILAAKPAFHNEILGFCPYCGESLNGKVKKYIFCPFCGEKLA